LGQETSIVDQSIVSTSITKLASAASFDGEVGIDPYGEVGIESVSLEAVLVKRGQETKG
jgi:hypothetical protein